MLRIKVAFFSGLLIYSFFFALPVTDSFAEEGTSSSQPAIVQEHTVCDYDVIEYDDGSWAVFRDGKLVSILSSSFSLEDVSMEYCP